jgi:uncharacterized membrane protein YbhN (UPF0104 family)
VVAIIAVLATGAAVLLIGRVAHFATLSRRLGQASAGWLVVCALGELIGYAGQVFSYQAVARVSGGPRLKTLLALRVIGLSFGAFSVASSVGSLSVDFWALREAGEPAAHASARIIAVETLRWAVLGLAACVASVVVLVGSYRHPPWTVPVIWLGVVVTCFAAGIWISAPRRRDRFVEGSGGWVRRGLGVAVRALAYLRELVLSEPWSVKRAALAGATALWVGDLTCAWAALHAFGVSLPLAPLLLGYGLGFVSNALPLPAGGAGGVDAALTAGFVLAGAPVSAALLGALAFRVFNFWLPAAAALLSALTARGVRARLREVAQERSRTQPSSRSAS